MGDGEANCSLNSKGDDVSWNFGRFFVKVSFKIEPKKKMRISCGMLMR